jgi:putative mRNA 3-end processing factor
MIHPLTNGRHPRIFHYREKYGAITIGFSGWGINKNYRYMMNLDYAIPFSDHCDHNELLEVVKKCNPSKIYTVHGFDKEFANNLVNMGYDAEPVRKGSKIVMKKSKRIPKTKTLDIYF